MIPGKKYTFNNLSELTNVYEGMFGCNISGLWAFYNIEGEKVFDAEWENDYSRGEIKFSDGAVLMYKKGERNLSILYKDGTYKSLPYYSRPTNFVDGIAMVFSSKPGEDKNIYINTKGERVYANLDFYNIGGYDSENSSVVPPLRDGLRLFKDNKSNLFGYIDKDGNIKISPRFIEARSFSDGLALVKEKEGGLYFIDIHGKKAFEPSWSATSFSYEISDFSDGLCVFYDQKNIYYDKTGNVVIELPSSSIPFYDGYAWYSEMRGGFIDHIINVKLENYTTPVSIQVESNPTIPGFSPSGIAIIDNGYTAITPNGHILLKSEELSNRFFGFSEDRFSKAQVKFNDEEYIGFINDLGEFVVILK